MLKEYNIAFYWDLKRNHNIIKIYFNSFLSLEVSINVFLPKAKTTCTENRQYLQIQSTVCYQTCYVNKLLYLDLIHIILWSIILFFLKEFSLQVRKVIRAYTHLYVWQMASLLTNTFFHNAHSVFVGKKVCILKILWRQFYKRGERKAWIRV